MLHGWYGCIGTPPFHPHAAAWPGSLWPAPAKQLSKAPFLPLSSYVISPLQLRCRVERLRPDARVAAVRPCSSI